nr:uncharacterized protein LOC129393481 [Pan paniscus]
MAIACGNQRADSAAWEAAQLPVAPLTLLPAVSFPQPDLPDHPEYSPEEEKQALDLQASKNQEDWWILPDSGIFIPRALGETLISRLHSTTHLEGGNLAQLLRSRFKIPHLQDLANQAALRCTACAQVNAKQGPKPSSGHRLRGGSPGESLSNRYKTSSSRLSGELIPTQFLTRRGSATLSSRVTWCMLKSSKRKKKRTHSCLEKTSYCHPHHTDGSESGQHSCSNS